MYNTLKNNTMERSVRQDVHLRVLSRLVEIRQVQERLAGHILVQHAVYDWRDGGEEQVKED